MSPKRILASPIRLAVVALAVIALVVALSACGSSGGSTSSSTGAKPNMTSTTTAATGGASGDTVALKLIAYQPDALDVTSGASVTWRQMDPGVHTVTSGTVSQDGGSVEIHPDGKFDSGELATGKTFSKQFDTPGTYTYFCRIHPATMHGTITVK